MFAISKRPLKLIAPIVLLLAAIIVYTQSCKKYEREMGVTTAFISEITASTCIASGKIIDMGEEGIVQHGFCFSLSPNPDLSDSSVKLGTKNSISSFSETLSGLKSDSKYYVRAFAQNSSVTIYGNELSFIPQLTIGQNYEGGILAYILEPGDPGYIPEEIHGLIAAPNDMDSIADWGCNGFEINGADGTAIGTGYQNTLDIMNDCAHPDIAARLCADLVLGEYSDWYLPSKDELYILYQNSTAIGGFSNTYYWSSTENDSEYAWDHPFNSDSQFADGKGNCFKVRAIRAF